MQFKAVIYSIDHSINIVYTNSKGNWFNFRGRSYRKDRKSVCQVIEKGDNLKGTVEALYVEGCPVPLRSELDGETVSIDHLEEKMSEVTNNPQKSFLDLIFRR